MADIAGRPQWELQFDEKGKVTGGTSVADLVAGVAGRGVTDLFVFSHGWNEDEDSARRLYARHVPPDRLGDGRRAGHQGGRRLPGALLARGLVHRRGQAPPPQGRAGARTPSRRAAAPGRRRWAPAPRP